MKIGALVNALRSNVQHLRYLALERGEDIISVMMGAVRPRWVEPSLSSSSHRYQSPARQIEGIAKGENRNAKV